MLFRGLSIVGTSALISAQLMASAASQKAEEAPTLSKKSTEVKNACAASQNVTWLAKGQNIVFSFKPKSGFQKPEQLKQQLLSQLHISQQSSTARALLAGVTHIQTHPKKPNQLRFVVKGQARSYGPQLCGAVLKGKTYTAATQLRSKSVLLFGGGGSNNVPKAQRQYLQTLVQNLFGACKTAAQKKACAANLKVAKATFKKLAANPKLELVHSSSGQVLKELEHLSRFANKNGLNLSLKLVDKGGYSLALASGQFSVLYSRISWNPSNPLHLFSLWHSQSANGYGQNFSAVNSPKLDALLTSNAPSSAIWQELKNTNTVVVFPEVLGKRRSS